METDAVVRRFAPTALMLGNFAPDPAERLGERQKTAEISLLPVFFRLVRRI